MDGTPTRLMKYLPHVGAATFAVAVFPFLVATRLDSIWWSVSVGVALSALASGFGSWFWSRRPRADDLVFGDLMLWGWLRRVRIERRLARATDDLGLDSPLGGAKIPRERRTEILQDLASTLEAKDPYTHGHTRRVTRHSYMIARTMGLPAEQVELVRVAASVHDVGKLYVSTEVLHKEGKLTDDEFAQIKEHSAKGAEIVSKLGIPEITALVRHHHERLDGKGYPDQLRGEDIPLGARIIAVADTFDAITSTRSYRSARGHRQAIEILNKEAGTQLDPDAVGAFLKYYSGRSAFEWWASVTTLPQRLLGSLGSWLQGAGGAGLVQGAAAVGAAVVIGSAAAPLGHHASEMANDRATSDQSTAAASGDGDVAGGREPGAGDDRVAGPGSDTGLQDDGPTGDTGAGEDGAGDGPAGEGQDGTDPGTSAGGDSGGSSGGSDGSGDTTDTGGDTTTDTGGATTDTGSDTTDTGGDTIGDTTDTVGGVVDDTTDTVGGTIGDTTDTVGDTTDTTDTTTDTTTGTIGDTTDTVGGIVGGLGGI